MSALEAGVSERRRRGGRGVRAWWSATGLRWRLTVYLGVAVAVLLGAFTVLSLQAINRAQEQGFLQQLNLARAVAEGLEREFSHVGDDVYAHFPRAPSPSAATESLATLHAHLANRENLGYFRVSAVRLVDAEGRAVLAIADGSGVEETLPAPEMVQEAISQGQLTVASSRLPVTGAVPFAAIVVPLPASLDAPQGAAVVVDTVGRALVNLFFSGDGEGEGGSGVGEEEPTFELEVLRSDGVVVVTSKEDFSLGRVSLHYSLIRKLILEGRAGAAVHDMPGSTAHPDHIVAITPLRAAPFFLVAEEAGGLLLGWPQQLRSQAILFTAIAVVVVLALGWLVGWLMVRPVTALRRATARIKGGDLDTPVAVRTQGELAQLAEEVELMRLRLRDTVSSLDGLNRSLADQVQERTQQLRTVVARLMQAQEEERRRVARDLHDETAQGLTALGVILDAVALDAQEDKDRALKGIQDAREEVRRLVAETRRLAYALRPSVLDDAGLVPALRWCAEAYLEAEGVRVSLETSRAELRLAEPVEVALFRVGQEAMSNIAKHARASHVWVSLELGEAWATLTVRDDGVGFDAQRMIQGGGALRSHGLGLAGMQERVDLLGGQLHIASHPGEGTTITAYVPTGTWEEENR